jgi:hypothetical protein
MGEKKNTYGISIGEPQERGGVERPRRTQKDRVKMDPKEVVCEGVDWIHLAQYRDQRRALVNTVINLRVP